MKKGKVYVEGLLTRFGNYLLSEERISLYKKNPNFPNENRLDERLKQVNDADLQNFFKKLKPKEKLTLLSEECESWKDKINKKP